MVGCSSPEGDSDGMPDGASVGGADGSAISSGGGENAAGSGGVDSNSGGSGGEAVNAQPLVPEGSRQTEYVLNLVDPDLVQAMAEFMQQSNEEGASDASSLAYPARVFYENFKDEYDFLMFIGDRVFSEDKGGLHERVFSDAIAGTGVERSSPSEYFGSVGRLMSAIGLEYFDAETFPPMAHEVAHHWGVYLDESLGFGDEFTGGEASHWGTTSVAGQLGGFKLETLRCKIPEGMVPPDCTPESNGRIHYVAELFSPRSSWDLETRMYAPLELYVMGLLPIEELPDSFVLLEDAEPDPVEIDANGSVTIDAAGITEIFTSDILDVQGPRALLPDNERAYRGALVLLTETPASDELLQTVSAWAAAFGGHVEDAAWPSFFDYTGGRATMDMRLGERRAPGEEFVPPDRPEEECDILLQDCQETFGCYDAEIPLCLKAGGGVLGDDCYRDADCEAGLTCAISSQGDTLCAPFCDAEDDTSELACNTLCPGSVVTVVDSETFEDAGAYCLGGSGTGICDPLVQDCGAGSGCYGRESTTCGTAGDIPQWQECAPLGNVCEPGSECIGISGESSFCQPYCDPVGTGPNACETLCPLGAWVYGDYSICIPA
jgi:hypothetical protein